MIEGRNGKTKDEQLRQKIVTKLLGFNQYFWSSELQSNTYDIRHVISLAGGTHNTARVSWDHYFVICLGKD